ncbi:MAG: type I restriction-modification system subunit M [Prevotella sp.]|nr:type I restriction-modification system subunit M [Prevotella sp.]
MDQIQYNQLFNFIWNIANDVLVNPFNKSDYKKIIMPMLVLRRLDIILEDTHEAVLEKKKELISLGYSEDAQEQFLFNITKHQFYNTSNFTMKNLRGETNPIRLKQNFLEYLDGFSKDVQDIIEKLDLKHQVENLFKEDCLGSIIEKFTDDGINLGINPILNADGTVRLPGVDNHTLGTIFEELLRRFNEEYSVTEAGEHFTPRDYVALMADIAVIPIADKLQSATYSIYDGACGTGGILSIAEERIQTIAKERGKQVKINLYGQELQPETYATCKADLMLSSSADSFHYTFNGEKRERFFFGSTISNDGHSHMKFDFCISNPPFGTPWKRDLKAWGIGNDKSKITDRRFYQQTNYDDSINVNFIPDVGDPQMLFLANNVSRMKDTELGTRIVEVHNGSSLFTGNAGGGESNLRKYIIENDLLEAIIAMPEKDFYNTGIGTYIWVVTNRKESRRRGKVQLIDATEIKTPLRKNLGEKNCETNKDNRKEIMRLLQDFKETEKSKIFPNKEFGYWEIKVDRPLRLRVLPNNDITVGKLTEAEIEKCRTAMAAVPADTPLDDWNAYCAALGKLTKAILNKFRPLITVIDPDCKPVNGEADKNLRDIEQVPLLYEGGIEAFMQKEVLPYTPDAYVAKDETKVGYELSFTKYFYRPKELRSIEDISNDIISIENDTKGLLEEILTI